MKKEITLGQLLSVCVTLLIAIVTGWITMNNKIVKHEVEIEAVKADQVKTERTLERIEGKVEIVLITLQNKKDR